VARRAFGPARHLITKEVFVDWKLEVIVIPVSDVERSKAFYAEQVGFTVDHDTHAGEMRIVQLTPPGSACSIVIGTGMVDTPPGWAKGMQLVVPDIAAARDQLIERGVDAGPVQHFDEGAWVDGPGGPWNSFVHFEDPDGNHWILQERPAE
jgi:catechol 2,3-dioxygenase-like lactoylglutathione lyase family enzyme